MVRFLRGGHPPAWGGAGLSRALGQARIGVNLEGEGSAVEGILRDRDHDAVLVTPRRVKVPDSAGALDSTGALDSRFRLQRDVAGIVVVVGPGPSRR